MLLSLFLLYQDVSSPHGEGEFFVSVTAVSVPPFGPFLIENFLPCSWIIFSTRASPMPILPGAAQTNLSICNSGFSKKKKHDINHLPVSTKNYTCG